MKQSRHSNYQNFLQIKTKKNVHNDKIRFDWIKKIISSNYKIKTVTDIGSNLGYFCINFNKYFNTKSIDMNMRNQLLLKPVISEIKEHLKKQY